MFLSGRRSKGGWNNNGWCQRMCRLALRYVLASFLVCFMKIFLDGRYLRLLHGSLVCGCENYFVRNLVRTALEVRS